MLPKLSIITVNYNNREGLQKTIQSVLQQTSNGFEYLIIDGDSSDGSKEIIEDNKDRLSYWISEPDSGVYEAMNKGIRMAQGEYLLFLNSGDFLVNERVLEDVFSFKHESDLLLGLCNVSLNGKVIHTVIPPPKLTFGFLYHQGIPHQSTFIKSELFEKYGLYREEFRYNADIEFWYRTILLNNCTTETLTTVITDYNKHGMSFRDRDSELYKKEMLQILSNPLIQFLTPDYDECLKNKQAMEVYYWAKSKPLLRGLILGLHSFARRIMRFRN